jgi:hypothetical protein
MFKIHKVHGNLKIMLYLTGCWFPVMNLQLLVILLMVIRNTNGHGLLKLYYNIDCYLILEYILQFK